MKICLIGEFSGNLDEGYRNIAFNLSKKLSNEHDVLNINVEDITSGHFWKRIKKFDPHVVHYLTAPTLFSFIVLKLSKILCNKNTKLVISSLHPYSFKLLRNPVLRSFISLIKPNLILTQSYEIEQIFREIGCNTEFLPNGVDTKRFTPVSANTKEKLREKYGIDKEKFVILHVGHIRTVRGITILNRMQSGNGVNQGIVIGSSYFKRDEKLYQNLKENGCIVWNRYFERIEEIYALADCYLFPVIRGNSIFTPLSVLEAMSCNLPVISTRFEGLSRTFEEGNGLIFAEREEDFYMGLEKIKNGNIEIKTRQKVLPYSWENIGAKLDCIYIELFPDR